MKSGKQSMIDVANEIKMFADTNPCGMSDRAMLAVATGLRAVVSNAVATELSSDGAAAYLGVSVRTLGRLVTAGEIAPPRRKGFRRKAYDKASLDAYIERKS